jgi:hypothetical protein
MVWPSDIYPAAPEPGVYVEPYDPELGALGVCLRALLPLSAAARSRVLEYLDDRLKPGLEPEGEAAP